MISSAISMKTVAGFACFAAVAVAIGIVGAMVGHGLSWVTATVAFLLGGGAAVLTFLKVDDSAPLRFGLWDFVLWAAFVWASFRAFFWLLYPVGDSLQILSPYNLGDLSLHLGLIHYFASGIPFWPPSPILVGDPLTYPPASDFFNALLLVLGWDIRSGLIGVGFVWALLGALALWRYGGAFAMAAFLFGGGLAGFAIFRTGEFLEYGSSGTWKNAFLTMLVTQRGFLFALPSALVLLWSWRCDFFGASALRVPFTLQVVLYASMPLFQVHTFLFLSAALATALLANPVGWLRPVRLVAAAFLPASACMWAVTGGFRSGGALRWEPAWTLQPAGWTGFLVEFATVFALALWLVWELIRRDDRPARWITATSLAVALMAFLVPFTDWAWDNTKFLIWAWVAPAPFLWQYVLRPLPLAARTGLCVLLFFTGAIALTAGLDRRHGYHLALRSELADWEVLTADSPPEAIFAITPENNYNHPVLLLGRRVVCGYEGHLSSHGLDYAERLATLRAILAEVPGWRDLAISLGVHAIALRASENALNQPLLIRADPPTIDGPWQTHPPGQ